MHITSVGLPRPQHWESLRCSIKLFISSGRALVDPRCLPAYEGTIFSCRAKDVNHMTDLASLQDAVPLAGTGVRAPSVLHANLTAPVLVEHSLRKNEGRLSADGAIIVRTGIHTGRSVRDKFVVDEPATRDNVWWGKINQKLPEQKFALLKTRVQAYLQGRELFT